MLVALRDVALHGAYRYLQAPGDVRIWQAFQLGQQERLAHFRGQAVQKGIDLVQGFQDQGALFGRGGVRRRQAGQGLEVGPFERAAPVVVDDQSAGDGQQVGARLAQRGEFGAVAQHAHEGVLRQVGGVVGIIQLLAQPALQPAVMFAVQRVDGVLGAREVRGTVGRRDDNANHYHFR